MTPTETITALRSLARIRCGVHATMSGASDDEVLESAANQISALLQEQSAIRYSICVAESPTGDTSDLLDLVEVFIEHHKKKEADVAELADTLRLLHDYQNGCPLPKYEKPWNEAMNRAQNILARLGK